VRAVTATTVGPLRAELGAPEQPSLLGRQPIVTRAGRTVAYEFLYRSPSRRTVHVDRWAPSQQDRATATVLATVFEGDGIDAVAEGCRAFVNITRSYAVGALPLPADPDRLVLEIVESVPADAEVIAGLRRLRARGYRIAIDDFAGRDNQLALLPLADYVKVDARDLARGGAPLVDIATRGGAQLIAERIEDRATLARCVAAGFTLFQGDIFEATSVLDLTPVIHHPRTA